MSVIKDYGKDDWYHLWEKLEQEGNFGLDYVINPVLYPLCSKILAETQNQTMVDFGAGTGILGIQFLYGYQAAVAGLRLCDNLSQARSNTVKYIAVEGQKDLVKRGNEYLSDIGMNSKIELKYSHIGDSDMNMNDGSISLAVSRNFLMHLSIAQLETHIADVARLLRSGGNCVFAFLNPEYELWKFSELHPTDTELQEGQRYTFDHGAHGEHGFFYHYYKSIEVYECVFSKHFSTIEKVPAFPVDISYKNMYQRYYVKDMPMAYIYHLQKK